MTEILEQLSDLSIEELTQVISRSQQLISYKQEEAQRLAQLERERLERERLEKERKKQEEIAELQRRLRELQGEDASAAADEPPKAEQPQQQTYSMVRCPHCHQMIQSGNSFCYLCGKSLEVKETQQTVRPEPQPQPNPQPQQNTQANSFTESVNYMDESVKKWTTLPGEGDVFGWRDIKMTSPEEAKKLAVYIKITTKRILLSSESLMKARTRTAAFGAIGNLVVEEKGTPWVWIPLNAVRSYQMLDKKVMQIEAERLYTFQSPKAKDIYDALQKLIPNRAR